MARRRAAALTAATGERVTKSVYVGAAQSYLFDEEGHALERCWLWRNIQNGPWVCEPGASQQYIWLGDIPVAAVLANRHFDGEGCLISDEPEAIFYIHNDHLNTPRRLTAPSEPNNPIVWRWDSDAFGVGFANPNANNSPTRQWLSMDLRFPGQLWDEELWRHYNYFRDYDPYIGRYVQSDPIGLLGGVNTYGYARGRPIEHSDPLGLDVWVVINNNGLVGSHAGLFINTNGRVLYDPAGSYRQDIRGSGDTFVGGDADLGDYVRFQIDTDGTDVEVFHFKLTEVEDKKIIENIDKRSSCASGLCVVCTSDALHGVGPFKNLGKYRLPATLANRLRALRRSAGASQAFLGAGP